MLGAIIGDIIGSVYEFDSNNIKTKDFVFFESHNEMECTFTDDTVMTIAVAEALMQGGKEENFVSAMRKYGYLYPYAGYGGMFRGWLRSDNPKPYKSYGNGSAMRVSPVAWYFDTLEEVEKYAEISAAVTHNHPEGIKGAKATAAAIFLARTTHSKNCIKTYIETKYGYDLNRTLDSIRPLYRMEESCQKTVPEAIIAFLESSDFEDAIRNAISIGGDSDTVAAITGSIAEAYYGAIIDNKELGYNQEWRSFLDDALLVVVDKFIYKNIMKMDIGKLNISHDLYYALKEAGIATVAQITGIPIKEIASVANINTGALWRIQYALAQYGLVRRVDEKRLLTFKKSIDELYVLTGASKYRL